MSPPRKPSTGLNFRNWIKAEAGRATLHYAKRTNTRHGGNYRSPRTAASLARLRQRAYRTVAASKQYNQTLALRNHARIKKMLKEIANYEARRKHKLVRQPSGSFALARRN
jgi:hypothetical protein